jgi:hypothetical protein
MGITAQTLPKHETVPAIPDEQQVTSQEAMQESPKAQYRPPVLDVVKENPSAVKIIDYGDAPVTVSASKVSNIISVPYDIESISSSKFCPEKTSSPACINPDSIGRSTRQIIFPGVIGPDTDIVIVTSKKTYALSLQPYAMTPVHIQIRNKTTGKRGAVETTECPKSFPVVERLYETMISAIRDEQVEGYVERRVSTIHDTPALLFVMNKVLDGELWRVAFIDVVNKSKKDTVQVKENNEEVQTAISKLVGVPLIASLSRELIQPQNPKTIANGEDIATLVVIAERQGEAHDK